MDLDQSLSGIQTNGFCIIEDVIPASQCKDVRDSVLATVEQDRGNYNPETAVGFLPGVINHNQSFAPYLADQRLLGMADRLLGHGVRISFTSAIVNQPGNARGRWHADWPFNQKNAGHIPPPYPDAVLHLTTLWMLSPFSEENGGTLVMPGSHRTLTNPTAGNGVDRTDPFPGEMKVCGRAGSVLVLDSRLWHATAPNASEQPRVALAVRYAPWWLNLEVLRPESQERKRLTSATGKSDNKVPSVPQEVFKRLPDEVQKLYQHWVVGD
jgi:ectoine hydroxylase-related dioxygenase (phytanoyl-CoA dioxygenase family)